MEPRHRVVIVGGGFGGLAAAQALHKAPVDVTLIDRRNFHLFQPLLYQVATGGLSPANISAPLRSVLSRQQNTRVLMAEVVGFDADARLVKLADQAVPYDSLIVAAGSRHHYFGHPEWEQFAPGLKTVEDATTIRRRLLTAFEEAERTPHPEARQALLTFVVVGGGPTGVELAGAIAEVAHVTLRRDFRAIDPGTAKIILLEGADKILSAFSDPLPAKAKRSLERMGVTVKLNSIVTDVQAEQVSYREKDVTQTVKTHTVFWGAGVQASPLGEMLGKATGAEVDKTGRVVVRADMSLPGRPEVFVIGDLAQYTPAGGKPLPGLSPVAMQEGRYAVDVIVRRVQGLPPPLPFHYVDRGTMATIGRSAAVAQTGWFKISGFPAWLAWLFVHIIFLIEFQNRILVLWQWAWNYFTRNRSARLITGTDAELKINERSK